MQASLMMRSPTLSGSIFHCSIRAQTLNTFCSYAFSLSVRCTTSHALKAPFMGGEGRWWLESSMPFYHQPVLVPYQPWWCRGLYPGHFCWPTCQKHTVELHRTSHHWYSLLKGEALLCFTALNASVKNNAFKVSNNPTIQGWHAEKRVINILNQLRTIYGQPTPGILKINNKVFCSPYLAANAPEVLFCCIEECAKTALLGHNPYTDHQLIPNAIGLLLPTGLYSRPFEEWDCLLPVAGQTWIAMQTMIQEAFQGCLNAMAPTAGHKRYAPTLPY